MTKLPVFTHRKRSQGWGSWSRRQPARQLALAPFKVPVLRTGWDRSRERKARVPSPPRAGGRRELGGEDVPVGGWAVWGVSRVSEWAQEGAECRLPSWSYGRSSSAGRQGPCGRATASLGSTWAVPSCPAQSLEPSSASVQGQTLSRHLGGAGACGAPRAGVGRAEPPQGCGGERPRKRSDARHQHVERRIGKARGRQEGPVPRRQGRRGWVRGWPCESGLGLHPLAGCPGLREGQHGPLVPPPLAPLRTDPPQGLSSGGSRLSSDLLGGKAGHSPPQDGQALLVPGGAAAALPALAHFTLGRKGGPHRAFRDEKVQPDALLP